MSGIDKWPTVIYRRVTESERRETEQRGKPNWGAIEAARKRKMTGGFLCVPDNLCDGCFQYKSDNGACGCP
jgi:hypothetical protein